MKYKKKYKKILSFLLISIFIILFSGCSNQKSSNDTPVAKAIQALDTVIDVKVYGKNANKVIDLSFNRINEIQSTMSRFEKGSEVDLVNQNANKVTTPLSKDTYFVIDTALQYASLTHGAFNPLIGNVIDLWGIGTDHAKIPTSIELSNALSNLDYKLLTLDKDTQSAFLESDQLKLDLGAIAKGYAADEMGRIMKEEGITSAILNLGGNVLAIGSKPDGKPWVVGIQNPLEQERGKLAASIKVHDTSVVTSGNYERFFEVNGIRYHHIIDPSTGYPAESGIISSTIITPTSINADALSTSLYILGKDKGLALIESLPNTEAIVITKDLHVYTTSGVTDKELTILSEDFVYEKSR